MDSGIPEKAADSVAPQLSVQAALDVLKKSFPQTVFIGVPAPGKSAGKAPVIFDWNGDPASLAGWLEWLKSMLMADISSAVMGTGGDTEDEEAELGSEGLSVDEDLDAAVRAAVASGLAGPELAGPRSQDGAAEVAGEPPRVQVGRNALTQQEIDKLQVLPPS